MKPHYIFRWFFFPSSFSFPFAISSALFTYSFGSSIYGISSRRKCPFHLYGRPVAHFIAKWSMMRLARWVNSVSFLLDFELRLLFNSISFPLFLSLSCTFSWFSFSLSLIHIRNIYQFTLVVLVNSKQFSVVAFTCAFVCVCVWECAFVCVSVRVCELVCVILHTCSLIQMSTNVWTLWLDIFFTPFFHIQ